MKILLAVLAVLAIPVSALAQGTASPDGARVYIITPANGEIVPSPFKVRFGLSGMGVAPAGIQKAGTGHHHLLIDTSMTSSEMGAPIPADAQHVHFGGGQTEIVLELPAGNHTLQLLLADEKHVPHDPPVMSTPIVITVR